MPRAHAAQLVNWRGPQLMSDVRKDMSRKFRRIGGLVRARSRRKIGRRRRSRPGNPPGKVTGNLQRGVRFRIVTMGRFDETVVMLGAPHFHLLELGTVTMAPRPFMRPTILSNREDIMRIARGEK